MVPQFCASVDPSVYLKSGCSCDLNRAGPAAFCRDVPVELLAGAVRYYRRFGCIWSPAAVQHGQTPDKGTVIFFTGTCVSECMTLLL